MEEQLSLDFLRVVENAAIAAARTMGFGDRHHADEVAVEAMRKTMDSVEIDGTAHVIGPSGSGKSMNRECAGELRVFRARVTRLWRRILLCRSQTHRLSAARMYALEVRWLPVPRPIHPYPEQRFAASHPR